MSGMCSVIYCGEAPCFTLFNYSGEPGIVVGASCRACSSVVGYVIGTSGDVAPGDGVT